MQGVWQKAVNGKDTPYVADQGGNTEDGCSFIG